jgi:hypothetical protein
MPSIPYLHRTTKKHSREFQADPRAEASDIDVDNMYLKSAGF